MQQRLVISVMGTDRPGLVETVANLVAEQGGNWLESRMCRLGGEFAGILRFGIEGDANEALAAVRGKLEAEGLSAAVRVDSGESMPVVEELQLAFELLGPDRPGIVRQLSAALAAKGVNVEELSTECISAPMSGESLFNAHVLVQLSESADAGALCAAIERIADELGMDVAFEEEDDED